MEARSILTSRVYLLVMSLLDHRLENIVTEAGSDVAISSTE